VTEKYQLMKFIRIVSILDLASLSILEICCITGGKACVLRLRVHTEYEKMRIAMTRRGKEEAIFALAQEMDEINELLEAKLCFDGVFGCFYWRW
jgi:hypothetical protein